MTRLLYLVHRVPYTPNRGDRIRAFHSLRVLRSSGFRVHVLALAHDEHEHQAAAALSQLADSYDVVRVPHWLNRFKALPQLFGSTPLTHVLLDSPRLMDVVAGIRARFDPQAVLAFCSGMARLALSPPLSELPLVLDMVDVDSEKWAALARLDRSPLRHVYAREANRLRQFEAVAATAARRVAVITEREAAAMKAIAPRASITVVPNGVDVEHFRPPVTLSRTPTVTFCGVMSYRPNAHGALWFAHHVWPLVRQAVPAARLTLVGSNPPREVQRLAERIPGVDVTGHVDDVRPYLWSAAVAIAPLHTARGTQNKVLEALAAGLPCVVTNAVASGLPAGLTRFCMVEDDETGFAKQVQRALQSDAPRIDLARLDSLRWEAQLSSLPALIRDATAP